MDKHYKPEKTEANIYSFWEKNGFFTPKIESHKKPFCILLPPPNANAPLHMGHALYVVEDILCRWQRMKGKITLFLPGTDHAGIETQFVFEKELRQKGKSRFDYDRETLYQMINTYVEENRGIAKNQLKRLGFSLDWTRERYTLDKDILKTVFETFRKLYQDGLVYRLEKLVNFCTNCGTAFSDLEVVYKERADPLYYLKYGPFVLATVRPETKFGDTAVAVNPSDKRYKKWVGKEFVYHSLVGKRKMKVVADKVVDPEFGTGVVKVTPAHDFNDFEIAQRHNLPALKVINEEGRLNENTGRFAGLTVFQARKKVVEDLEKRGDLVKIDQNYTHRVGICYRCKRIIEPMLMAQWFVKIKPLAKKAIEVVKDGKVKIVPKRFEKQYFNWLKNIKDWNISRQIVWGPRIPAWYCLDCNKEILVTFFNKKGEKIKAFYKDLSYPFAEIKKGLQSLSAPVSASFMTERVDLCPKCRSKNILQETDTFDTWFSSGQWPLTTLGFPDSKDYKYFYPTAVLDTMWDILFFWVARMIMLCCYRTSRVPFKIAHMHSRIVDKQGKKMSKSRGNVINPLAMVEKYGADALRMALVYGIAPASDVALDENKIIAMRNFCNKVWNASRFIMLDMPENLKLDQMEGKNLENKDDCWVLKGLDKTIKQTEKELKKYRFGTALENLYQFFWHQFCDQYLEKVKGRKEQALPVLLFVLLNSLKLLHPFAPFLTEEIFQMIKKEKKLQGLDKALIISGWPLT